MSVSAIFAKSVKEEMAKMEEYRAFFTECFGEFASEPTCRRDAVNKDGATWCFQMGESWRCTKQRQMMTCAWVGVVMDGLVATV